MPQEMYILRCSACKTYQGSIVKKAKKWQCKVCNLKQIFRQVYFQGSGKECRLLVQKLNLARENDIQGSTSFDGCRRMNDMCFNDDPEPKRIKITENKWAKYLDTAKDVQVDSYSGSNNQSTSYEKYDDLDDSDKENTMFDDPQDDITNAYNDSPNKNDFQYDSDHNSNEESNDVPGETLDVESHSNDHNDNSNSSIEISGKANSPKNIFDDNEDLDLSIDF